MTGGTESLDLEAFLAALPEEAAAEARAAAARIDALERDVGPAGWIELNVMPLAEYGKHVPFRHDGGTIRDRKTGRTTELQKKHGVYVLKARQSATPESSSKQSEAGSTRQG